MRYLKYSIIFITSFLLIGCSTIRKLDKSEEYKNAPSYGKPIVLPADMKADIIENHYPVPKAQDNSASVSVLPPGSNLN